MSRGPGVGQIMAWCSRGRTGGREALPCLMGQREDLGLPWRGEDGSYRRLWAEEEGAYQVLTAGGQWQARAGQGPCFLFLFLFPHKTLGQIFPLGREGKTALPEIRAGPCGSGELC